jgi:integrase
VPRRNQGPRLRWLEKRSCFYIVWTENGRSREHSTRTQDRQRAEAIFGEWLQLRRHGDGPFDPTETLVADVLTDYARERGPRVTAPAQMGRSIDALTSFWHEKTVAEVTPQNCAKYAERRARAAGTVRRELGVLRAAINWAHKNARLTRSVAVQLPECPEPRNRWLTRQEAARLIRASRTQKARLYMPLFILLGLYTGRRKEAILSLRWAQVDLDERRIDFEIAGRRKTKKRRGVIPIPPRLLPHLVKTTGNRSRLCASYRRKAHRQH